MQEGILPIKSCFAQKCFWKQPVLSNAGGFLLKVTARALTGFKLTGKIPIKSQMRYNSLTMCNVDPWAPNLYTVFTLLKFALNATP